MDSPFTPLRPVFHLAPPFRPCGLTLLLHPTPPRLSPCFVLVDSPCSSTPLRFVFHLAPSLFRHSALLLTSTLPLHHLNPSPPASAPQQDARFLRKIGWVITLIFHTQWGYNPHFPHSVGLLSPSPKKLLLADAPAAFIFWILAE